MNSKVFFFYINISNYLKSTPSLSRVLNEINSNTKTIRKLKKLTISYTPRNLNHGLNPARTNNHWISWAQAHPY